MNHYERLGVGRDASTAEVRAAYRRLAQELHPDHGRPTRHEMAELNVAYTILRDAARRASYDRTLTDIDRDASPVAPRQDVAGTRHASSGAASGLRLRLLVAAVAALSAVVMVVLVLVALVEGY